MEQQPVLTLDRLSALSGESPLELKRWSDLGLLPGVDGALPMNHLKRVALIRYAADRGIDAEELARVCAEQDMLDWFLGDLPDATDGDTHDFDDLADLIDLSPELMPRLRAAAGLLHQKRADQVDLEALRGVAVALQSGIPEEALLQLIRVYGDSLGRAADATVRLFHLYVHEAFRGAGLEGPQLAEATRAVSDQSRHLVEPTIFYLFRKGWEKALSDDFIVHVREAQTPAGSVRGEVVTTVLFVDLSSFTPLTEAMGDESAAAVVNRFSEIVRLATAAAKGQVVKQIGDAFMLVFRDPVAAVECGLTIDQAVTAEPAFPAVRMGAHTGAVLYREGDYIGANVNLAARVAAGAGRHQLLVTEAVSNALADLTGFEVIAVGVRHLKGIAGEVRLFEVGSSSGPSRRTVDPVCGMEMERRSVVAELTWEGRELHFCSPTCLQRFAAAPDHYLQEVGLSGRSPGAS